MKQKSLDTIILEEVIRAKLAEQRGATISQKPGSQFTKNLTVPLGRGNWAATVADLIYNAKGYFVDDEEKAKEVIERNIKNIQQYKDVTKELQKLSGGRGLGAYLRSFMDLSDRLEVVSYLMDRLPANQWNWTVKAIVPWDDFKHFSTGGSAYQRSGLSGNYPKSGPAHRGWTKLMTLYADKMKTRGEELWGETLHNVKFVSSIATAVVPVIGPVISAAISLSDAKQYYDEGDKYSAGLITVLSLIPGGKAVAKALTRKIITKNAALTAAEKAVLTKLATNKTLVKEQLGKLLQKAVESGKITDAMLKSIPSIVKPVGKGIYTVIGTGIRIITPLVVYDQAWNAANPNVTEAEMKAVVAEANELLRRRVNSMFASILKSKPKSKQIGESINENNFEFEPSDGAEAKDTGGAQDIAFWAGVIGAGAAATGAGIAKSGLAGGVLGYILGKSGGGGVRTGIMSIPRFIGKVFKLPKNAIHASMLIRDTYRLNKAIQGDPYANDFLTIGKFVNRVIRGGSDDLTIGGFKVLGFTRKEYAAIIGKVDERAFTDIKRLALKVRDHEMSVDDAVLEFTRGPGGRGGRIDAGILGIDEDLLRTKFDQISKLDPRWQWPTRPTPP